MQLTVLGCAGTFPGPESPCSSYLVEHDGYRLVIDLGAGALGSLQRHADLREIDALYITHLHADHCIDLVAYSYALRFHPRGQPLALPVHGPIGTRQRILNCYDEVPMPGLLEVFDFQEHTAQELELGPFRITSAVVRHPIESHGLRIEAAGRVLTYSADTAVCSELVTLARDSDLFLCEASWTAGPETPEGIHLTGREAGEAATEAGAKRVVLTHVIPSYDPQKLLAEAKETYDGPLELARLGAVYQV